VEQAASDLQLGLNIVHEHDSARVIRSLYQCGGGFTFSPACSVAENPQPQNAGSAWIVARVCNPDLQRRYYLARQPGRTHDAAVQVVQDALLLQVQAMIGEGRWPARWDYAEHRAQPSTVNTAAAKSAAQDKPAAQHPATRHGAQVIDFPSHQKY
jgi:hypothetical protein